MFYYNNFIVINDFTNLEYYRRIQWAGILTLKWSSSCLARKMNSRHSIFYFQLEIQKSDLNVIWNYFQFKDIIHIIVSIGKGMTRVSEIPRNLISWIHFVKSTFLTFFKMILLLERGWYVFYSGKTSICIRSVHHSELLGREIKKNVL